jgi:chromosome partitioning protein
LKIIVTANRKGGTGKTTVAYNLGASYALAGKRICYIDLDSQANLTMLCRVPAVSLDDFKAVRPIQLSPLVSILPATKAFKQLENEIDARFDRNTYLRDEILPRLEGFDYLVVDTSPSLSVLNVNSFAVADMVHIIVNADRFSLDGLVEMKAMLAQVKAVNPRLEWSIVLNAANKGRKLAASALDILRKEPGYSGIEIPNRQHFDDSNALRQPALDFDEIRDPFATLAAVI